MTITGEEKVVLEASLTFLLSCINADKNGLEQDGMELTVANVTNAGQRNLELAKNFFGLIAGSPPPSYEAFHNRVQALSLRIVEAIEKEGV